MDRAAQRLVALDGLRGIAAIAVVIGHLFPGLFPNTSLAVDFFFMLSGFVLVHAFDRRLEKGMAFPEFMVFRCIRLFPMIVLGTVLGAVAAATFVGLSGMLLIPLSGPLMYPLNPPAWSLLFEMIGSALIGIRLWQRSEVGAAILLGISALALAVAILHRGSIDAGWSVESFHYGMVRVMFGFSAGGMLYRLRPTWTTANPLPLALLVLALLMPVKSPAYQLGIALILFPWLLVIAANAPSFRGAKTLGDLSYPLYIVHVPVFLILAAAWWPLQMFAAIAVATLAGRYYDEPVRRWLTRKMRDVRWQAAQGASRD